MFNAGSPADNQKFIHVQDSKKSINVRGRLLHFDIPAVMGILNITPDSFYNKSRFTAGQVVDIAGQMLRDGAKIIDVGGYSTRPNASEVSEEEEIERLMPVVEVLKKQIPESIVSVDTYRARVAEETVGVGADIINDVGGGTLDAAMFDTVVRLKVPYILMHMRGNPQNMQQLTQYNDLLTDIIRDLSEKIRQLRTMGLADIIVDPGFGFAKTIEQNFKLMNYLEEFIALGCPLLSGISRKGMIWKTLEIQPEEALNGTTVLNTVALMKGASILRVHDVKEAVEAVKLVQQLSAH